MTEIYLSTLIKWQNLSIQNLKLSGEKLKNGKSDADLSYLLATIKTDVVLDIRGGAIDLS